MEKQFTAQQIIDAITEAKGFLSPAAARLGCSVKTVERYIRDFPTVAEARREAKFKRDDFVEAKIMERIRANSDTMIIFYAKTQMKDRGYVERQEITNYNIDPSRLTDEQLQRIADGEDPARVLASTTESGG